MEHEPIWMDGVDVKNCKGIDLGLFPLAKCKFLKFKTSDGGIAGIWCSDHTHCYYKKLARKTAECELLETQLESYHIGEAKLVQRNQELEQECEQIKEKYEALKLENQEGYEIVAALKHECEELKKQLMQKSEVDMFFNTPIEGWSSNLCGICKFKNCLTEIKEIAESFCNACQEFEPEKKGSNCMYCNYGIILRKISEVEKVADKEQIIYTEETCPYCDSVIELPPFKGIYECPECKELIVCCSMCEEQSCNNCKYTLLTQGKERLSQKTQECEKYKKRAVYFKDVNKQLGYKYLTIKQECEELKKELMRKDEVNTFFNTPIEGWSSNPCDVCESKNNYDRYRKALKEVKEIVKDWYKNEWSCYMCRKNMDKKLKNILDIINKAKDINVPHKKDGE